MLDGVNPFGLVGEPNVQGTGTVVEAAPKNQSVIGVYQTFDGIVYDTFTAALGVYKAFDQMNQADVRNYDPNRGAGISTPTNIAPGPGAHGFTTVTLLDVKCASLWGAPLTYVKNADGSTSFVSLPLNEDWQDLDAAVKAGKCNVNQIAAMVHYGLFSDPAIRAELVDAPIPAVVAAFRATKNGSILLDSWLASPLSKEPAKLTVK